MNDKHGRPVLLVGGTGKTGRRVEQRLNAMGIPVRIGARLATPRFDWNDRSSWEAALEGVSAAYITYYPDIALPGAVDAIEAFTSVALAKGVKRLVLLSGRGEEEAQKAEQVLMSSGANWTIVRASWFSQNFSENFFREDIIAGEIVFPRDGIPEPFIDAGDIADVVVAALGDERHVGQIYEVTGPRMLTFREAISEISRATARDIDYVPISVEDYAAALRSSDAVPLEFVELLELLTREVLDGRNTHVTDGVRRALGREPRDFSEYAREAADAGFWTRA